MTALLGGSVLLIAASAAALVYGWLNAENTFIWGSIIATATAAILVVIAYVRSSKEPIVASGPGPEGAATAEGPVQERSPEAPADQDATQAQPATGEGATEAPVEESAATAAIPASAGAAGAEPTGGPVTSSEDTEADGGESGEPGSGSGEVVGIPSTKKFHKPDCRYAGVASAEQMSRADAEAKDFKPCGVCKP